MSTPPATPPATDVEYLEWANRALGINFEDSSIKLSYEQNATFVQTTAQDHDFFKGLGDFLIDSSTAYSEAHNAELFMGDIPNPTLKLKSFESAINKSFRHNVVLNDNFSAPPDGEWVTPGNWFRKFD